MIFQKSLYIKIISIEGAAVTLDSYVILIQSVFVCTLYDDIENSYSCGKTILKWKSHALASYLGEPFVSLTKSKEYLMNWKCFVSKKVFSTK